jgi:hypothetical protein
MIVVLAGTRPANFTNENSALRGAQKRSRAIADRDRCASCSYHNTKSFNVDGTHVVLYIASLEEEFNFGVRRSDIVQQFGGK